MFIKTQGHTAAGSGVPQARVPRHLPPQYHKLGEAVLRNCTLILTIESLLKCHTAIDLLVIFNIF